MSMLDDRRSQCRHRWSVAREHHGPYVHAATHGSAASGEPARSVALDEAVDDVTSLDLDPLDDTAIRAELDRVQQAIRKLTAFRARAAGLLEQRALRAAGPGREQQALRTSRRRLAEDLRLTPSQAKQESETGRRIAEHPAAEAAMTAGDLPTEHARLLAETLRALPQSARVAAEDRLLRAARHEDARAFGRSCRRLLARIDGEAAQAAQDRRNARRSLRLSDTPDGMTAVYAQGSGLDAEYVHTAIHAFRRPDAPGQRRTSEQRSWDALVDVCRAALGAGAPTNHGVRPHVMVLVDHEAIRTAAGVAEAAWTGPLPWTEVRNVLSDCGVSRILTDPAGLPLEAGEEVRTVPSGLRKALHVRDETCVAHGCDIPAAWCDIMHLDVPYRLRGRLSLDNAAPGCRFHHRMLDRHGWTVTWVDARPVLHHPDRPPRGSSGRPAANRARSPARARATGHDTTWTARRAPSAGRSPAVGDGPSCDGPSP